MIRIKHLHNLVTKLMFLKGLLGIEISNDVLNIIIQIKLELLIKNSTVILDKFCEFFN